MDEIDAFFFRESDNTFYVQVGLHGSQTFADLKRVQALLKRLNRANTIILKLDDPQRAPATADEIERRFGYKSVSWQEANEDLMSTLTTRNIIMYTVVSAVLIVAAFGIYNVISTVVLEKQRDIAILKSMGFRARDIRRIFLIQGVLLGFAGSVLGLPLGAALMLGLMQIRLNFPAAAIRCRCRSIGTGRNSRSPPPSRWLPRSAP